MQDLIHQQKELLEEIIQMLQVKQVHQSVQVVVEQVILVMVCKVIQEVVLVDME